MGKIRRKDRAITQEEATALLNTAEYGVLSTVSENGEPYGVPLNYCVIDTNIYFHCAVEGKKLDNIRHNQSVSFCVVGDTEILPDTFATKYESVIVSGEIEEVFDSEKQTALEGLLHKYSPDYFDKGLKYIEELTEKTKVFKISVNDITGKARK